MNKFLRLMPLAFVAGGCYTYVPVPLSSAPQGSQVRAHLSAHGVTRIENLVGPLDNDLLTGRVADNHEGAVTLDVTTGSFKRGVTVDPQRHDFLPIDGADLLQFEIGRLNRPRTTVASLFVAAGAYGIILVGRDVTNEKR